MSRLPLILLWGEEILDPVRRLLRRTHVGADDFSSRMTSEDIEREYDLVVMSLAQSLELDAVESAGGPGLPGKPVRVVIHNQDFLPLRERLRRGGVDFLVQSSVDPEVLRLLFLHALFRGPEKRSSPRLLVGSRVTYSTTEERGPATLVDLNAEGCRLLCHHQVPRHDMPVSVAFPADLAGGEALVLRGRSVRVEVGPGDDADRHFAVAFESLAAPLARRLDDLLTGKPIGALVTHLAEGEPRPVARAEPLAQPTQPENHPVPAAPSEEPTEDGEKPDRRRSPRVPYSNLVTALIGDETRVLLGRDLSRAGVRVEPAAELTVGRALRVAIYGAERTEPVVVPAVVTRDDGEQGLLLRFDQAAVPTLGDLEGVLRTRGALGELTRLDVRGGPVVVSGGSGSSREP